MTLPIYFIFYSPSSSSFFGPLIDRDHGSNILNFSSYLPSVLWRKKESPQTPSTFMLKPLFIAVNRVCSFKSVGLKGGGGTAAGVCLIVDLLAHQRYVLIQRSPWSRIFTSVVKSAHVPGTEACRNFISSNFRLDWVIIITSLHEVLYYPATEGTLLSLILTT